MSWLRFYSIPFGEIGGTLLHYSALLWDNSVYPTLVSAYLHVQGIHIMQDYCPQNLSSAWSSAKHITYVSPWHSRALCRSLTHVLPTHVISDTLERHKQAGFWTGRQNYGEWQTFATMSGASCHCQWLMVFMVFVGT